MCQFVGGNTWGTQITPRRWNYNEWKGFSQTYNNLVVLEFKTQPDTLFGFLNAIKPKETRSKRPFVRLKP